MRRLRHANVVPVLEVSDRGGTFISGAVLRMAAWRVHPTGATLRDELILIMRHRLPKACTAHRRGIIHRDLKPTNILLAANGKACLGTSAVARSMFNDTIVDVERQQFEGRPDMSPACVV